MAIVCERLGLLFVMVPATGCSVVGKLLVDSFDGKYLPEKPIVREGKVVHDRKHNSVAKLLEDGLIDERTLDSYLVVANVRNPYDRFTTYYQRLQGEWTEASLDVRRRYIERRRDQISQREYENLMASLERSRQRLQWRQRVMKRLGFNTWMLATIARFVARRLRRNRRQGDDPQEFLFPMLHGVDVAIRNEMLEQGLNEVLQLLQSGRSIELPRKNVTPGKKQYMEYYSFPVRFLFGRLFAKPLRAFGYSFGRNDPRLASSAGTGKAEARRGAAISEDVRSYRRTVAILSCGEPIRRACPEAVRSPAERGLLSAHRRAT